MLIHRIWSIGCDAKAFFGNCNRDKHSMMNLKSLQKKAVLQKRDQLR